MSPTGFVLRVALDSAVALGVLALGAAWLAGSTAGVGMLAGGGLAVGNLWWLGRRAAAATASDLARWPLVAVIRFTVVGLAAALVLASGLAHPVALVVGLTVLPCAIVARGLKIARVENWEA